MNDYLQICAEFFRQPEGHALLIVIGLLAITLVLHAITRLVLRRMKPAAPAEPEPTVITLPEWVGRGDFVSITSMKTPILVHDAAGKLLARIPMGETWEWRAPQFRVGDRVVVRREPVQGHKSVKPGTVKRYMGPCYGHRHAYSVQLDGDPIGIGYREDQLRPVRQWWFPLEMPYPFTIDDPVCKEVARIHREAMHGQVNREAVEHALKQSGVFDDLPTMSQRQREDDELFYGAADTNAMLRDFDRWADIRIKNAILGVQDGSNCIEPPTKADLYKAYGLVPPAETPVFVDGAAPGDSPEAQIARAMLKVGERDALFYAVANKLHAGQISVQQAFKALMEDRKTIIEAAIKAQERASHPLCVMSVDLAAAGKKPAEKSEKVWVCPLGPNGERFVSIQSGLLTFTVQGKEQTIGIGMLPDDFVNREWVCEIWRNLRNGYRIIAP